jgi:ABC-type sugar transport system ATPase subunit
MNFFNVDVADGALRLAGRVIEPEPETFARISGCDNLILGLRPKDIKESSIDGRGIPATVELVEQLGSETYLHLKIAGVACVASVEPDSHAKIDDVVKIEMNMSKAYFFKPDGVKI